MNFKLPKKSNIRLVKNRIDYFIDLCEDGIMSKEEVLRRMEG